MASNPDFVQFIVDQCARAGEISARKMFGDYGLYCDGKIVGLICDNAFFLKPTDAARPLLREVILRPPYPGASNYFFIDEVDNSDTLSSLVRATALALPEPKKKSSRKRSDRR